MAHDPQQDSAQTPGDELNLLDYWFLIRKHARQIVGLGLAVMLLAALVVYQMTPVYRSTVQVMIESSKSQMLTLNDLYEGGRESRESFNSQVEVLKSRTVAERVIRKLKLYEHPLMDPRQQKSLFGSPTEYAGSPAEIERQLIDDMYGDFDKNLTIEPVRLSQVVKVSFDSPDAELAARIANEVVEAYIENDLEARSQMTQRANQWLMQHMDGLRVKLEDSEKALQAYREKENIIDSKGVVLSGSAKQLEEVSSALIVVQQRMAEAESAYLQVKDYRNKPLESLESLPAVLKSPAVQQSKQNEADALRKLTELRSRYTAAHPKSIAAESELNSARAAVKRDVEAVINGIIKEYEITRSNLTATNRNLDQVKEDIQSLTRKEFQLGVLQREVESSRQLYDLFVSKAKESDVLSNLQSTVGRVVDAALPAANPLKPKKGLIIAIAFVLGLLGGIALVFLLDYLDNTLHSVSDVERRLGVDVLGTVQVLEKDAIKSSAARAFLEDSSSLFAESIRSIRTAVLLSSIDDPHRVVMVTSTLPGEGKTTLSINLAFALGQMKRVLLVDGDIRKPGLAKSVGGLESARGLVDYLAEEAPLEACIQKTDNPNVFVLPAGKRFNSPLELLSSQHFADTIDKLKDMFDVVLIDCPPLKPVSDSLVISRYANAVLYVVKADATPHQLAHATIRRLKDIEAPLLGVILNQLDLRKSDRYGQYAYQYEYAYGAEPKRESKTFLGIKV